MQETPPSGELKQGSSGDANLNVNLNNADAAKAEPKKRGRKPKMEPPAIGSVAVLEPPSESLPKLAAGGLKRSKHAQVEVIWMDRRFIKGAPYNPRKMTATARVLLRQSIQQHKLLEPFIWNRLTGYLVSGHQRLSTLDQLEGREDYLVPVNPVEKDDVTEHSLNLAMNNVQMQGEPDAEKMVEQYRDGMFDLDLAGYNRLDIEMFALDAGHSSEYLESIFNPDARDKLNAIADEVDSLMDESDAIKRRDTEKKKDQERRNGSSNGSENGSANGNGDGRDDASEPEDQEKSRATDRSKVDGDENSEDAETDHEFEHAKDSGEIGDAEYDSEPDDGDENDRSAAYRKHVEELKEARKPTSNMQAAAEVSYYGMICFGNDEQKFRFFELAGADPFSKFVSGNDLAKLLNWELPELPKPAGKSENKSEKKNDGKNEKK